MFHVRTADCHIVTLSHVLLHVSFAFSGSMLVTVYKEAQSLIRWSSSLLQPRVTS